MLTQIETPEQAGMVAAMLGLFQRIEPSLKGQIEPEDRVRMQLEIIDKLDKNMSGKFVSHHGDQNWF
jgi:hypothetical protein